MGSRGGKSAAQPFHVPLTQCRCIKALFIVFLMSCRVRRPEYPHSWRARMRNSPAR